MIRRLDRSFVGEATFGLPGGLEPVPFYHFTGGTFDAQGIPSGLLYSNEADLFHFEIAAVPTSPTGSWRTPTSPPAAK